jgi:bifunctional non-homologous end joining protein LigD
MPGRTTTSRSRRRSAPAGALAAYRHKRDLTRSPEPAGVVARGRTGALAFCVQKHLASHLHYDFRLEHRGVLLSWAVPKGPSPDPATKRLAMQVEDHPLAYGSFEGVIPSGYGAGIVVLWDRGVWQPLVDDVDAALARGRLPFLLLGEKLKGGWSLVRATRAGATAWLLIKSRDAWATTDDPTRSAPGSVASDGDFPEVLARQPRDPWPRQPPAVGGQAGALFRRVITAARRLRSGRG